MLFENQQRGPSSNKSLCLSSIISCIASKRVARRKLLMRSSHPTSTRSCKRRFLELRAVTSHYVIVQCTRAGQQNCFSGSTPSRTVQASCIGTMTRRQYSHQGVGRINMRNDISWNGIRGWDARVRRNMPVEPKHLELHWRRQPVQPCSRRSLQGGLVGRIYRLKHVVSSISRDIHDPVLHRSLTS